MKKMHEFLLIVSVAGFLAVIFVSLNNLFFFVPLHPTHTIYTMDIEVIQPTHYLIVYDYYFNLSDDDFERCAALKSAVITLNSEALVTLRMEVNASEYECITAIFEANSNQQPLEAFCYQSKYYVVRFATYSSIT